MIEGGIGVGLGVGVGVAVGLGVGVGVGVGDGEGVGVGVTPVGTPNAESKGYEPTSGMLYKTVNDRISMTVTVVELKFDT